MKTHVELEVRANDFNLIKKEIEFFIKNPIIDELLYSASGFLAVLGEDQQIVAVNDVKAQFLGFDNVQAVLGLRIGEAIKCIHAGKIPGGCGTGEICQTCGLAMSIISCLASGKADERKCSLITENAGKRKDLFFRARCSPLTIDSKRFLLLFLQDVSYQQRLIAIEKKIFHDINNSITGLVGTTQLMTLSSDELNENIKELSQIVVKLSSRLVNETAMQRSIIQNEAFFNPPNYDFVSVSQIFSEIKELFSKTLSADHKSLIIRTQHEELVIKTNKNFFMIVIDHMVKNALEETGKGDSVRVWTQLLEDQIIFNVWNSKRISKNLAKKLFQRNFTTKPGVGRGYGTYSMKLFGEEILGGIVDFTTSEEGTVFRISLPILP